MIGSVFVPPSDMQNVIDTMTELGISGDHWNTAKVRMESMVQTIENGSYTHSSLVGWISDKSLVEGIRGYNMRLVKEGFSVKVSTGEIPNVSPDWYAVVNPFSFLSRLEKQKQ